MQKIAIAGVGLGAVAVALVGGYFYANTRAKSEIEANFAALRASGATATHGPISVSLFKRRADIVDIVIKPAGANGDVTIGKLVLDGIDIWASDFVASRVELSNLTASNLGGATPDGRISIKLPSLTATAVRSARSAPAAGAGAAANMDDLQRAMLAYSQFAAESITVPTLEVSSPVRVPVSNAAQGSPSTQGTPPPLVNMLTTYSNLKLEKLRDGRIGRVAFDKATIGSDKGAAFFTGTINGSTIADLDIMPFFGIGLAGRTARDGYYPVQGKMTMGAYTISMLDGTEIAIGGASGSGMQLNPAKFSYAQVRDMMGTITAMPPQATPAQQQAFLGAIANIYEGIGFDGIDVRDIKVTGPKAAPQSVAFAIGGMSMSRFAGGKLGEMRVDNLSGTTKSPSGATVPIKLGSFALQGFDVSKIMRIGLELSAAGPGKPPASPEKALAMLSALEGIELRGIAMPDPRTGLPLQLDHLKLGWGQFVNDLPSKIVLSFKGTTPINPTDPSMATLRNLGFQSLSFSSDVTTDWDAATRVGSGVFAADVQQLGMLSADVKIGNIPRSAFSIRPGQLQTILPDLEIGALQLKLRDNGLVKIARGALGGDAQADPLAAIKQALLDPARPASNLSAILDGASTFLASPGQSFSLSLKAKGRIPVSQFTAPGAFQAPDALVNILDAFTAEVAVSR